MTAKPCPVRGCGALIREQAALCAECWARLPFELQQRLPFHGRSRADAEVYAEAIAYLNALPPRPARTGVQAWNVTLTTMRRP